MTVPYPGVYGQPPQQQPPYAPPPQHYQPQPQYAPQQGYAPQPQYPAPGQGYGQQPPQPPAPPLAQGSLDDFYNQPSSGGGAGLKFSDAGNQPMVGKWYAFRVTRPLTQGDVQQQVDKFNNPLTWRDGRPKFVMIVPGELVSPDPAFPDGLVKWYCKGQARDELSRAMAEAGAPEGAPEAGATIVVTLSGTRPSGPGMNASHQFAIQYFRPAGAQPAPAAPVEPQHAPAPAAQPQLPPANYQPAPAPQQYQQQAPPAQYAEHAAAAQGYAPQPTYAPQQAAPQQMAQQAPPAPAPAAPATGQVPPQAPADFSPAQQELLARLTGQQAPGQAQA